jgi:hypothetical protein
VADDEAQHTEGPDVCHVVEIHDCEVAIWLAHLPRHICFDTMRAS